MELKDILVGSILPLHPFLAGNPCLSIRATVDGKCSGRTPFVSGDLQSGIWEMGESLKILQIGNSVSLTIVAGPKEGKILAELDASNLLMRMREQPDLKYHEISPCHSCSPIQIIVTCSVEVLSPVVPGGTITSRVPAQTTIEEHKAEDFSKAEGKDSLSPEVLENYYTKVHRLGDRNARAHALNLIGCSFLKLYYDNRVVAQLKRAISILEQSMEYTSLFDSRLAKHSSDLGSALLQRFLLRNNIVDIDKAIFLSQNAVKVTNNSDQNIHKWLNNLANCYASRFDRFDELEDANKAIVTWKQSVRLMSDSDLNKHLALGGAGASFLRHFERSGNLRDITEAILLQQAAVDLTPGGHPDKPSLLNNLGSAIQTRFERLGDVMDLEKVISFKQAAVGLTPDGHPDKPALLNNLGGAVQKRFERLGDVMDLEKAISFLQAAVDLTPHGHPDKPSRLTNLGGAVQRRFERLGDVIDLEKAITFLQAAVDLTPDGHPDKPALLNNLGSAVRRRFERLGDVIDLEKAILFLQAAVDLPDGHRDKPGRLNNLGGAVQTRFERLGDVIDLEKAISFKQAAVNLTPDGHPDKPGWLNNLGSAVQRRFERLGDVMDLEKAISFEQAAVDLTPDGHPDKPGRLNNLGSAVRRRFERLGDVIDLEKAISFLQAAVDLTPDGHPDKPGWLSNLGNTFVHRFLSSKLSTHLQSVILSFSTAANSLTGPSVTRFKAACAWGKFSHLYGQSPIPAFECAINLLPQVAWLGTSLTTQHAQLIEAGDQVRYAVSVAIELGEYETAVQWAEYSRSIVWQNLLSLRTPLDDLQKAHPELAMRLQSVSRELEGTLSNSHPPKGSESATLQDLANKATTLAAEREESIEEIRNKPGFESFLRAKTFDKLAPAAHEGPVAIINIHERRCDALVLIPHDSQAPDVSIVHIPLESFTHVMSETLFRDFNKLLSSAGVRARDTRKSEREASVRDNGGSFKSILHNLWLHVVKPILDGLPYQPGDQSRIWWCATGPLAFLPIHAAGNYDSDVVGEKVSDYVISSYTPTLTALIDQLQPEVTSDFQLLTVAQPSTPHALPLPETEREVGLVKDIASGIDVKSLINEEATMARVLQAMKESNWIHLACHGIQDHKESLKSGFLLHDKILELAELIREPLPKADFAFLSACQTAKGDEKIAEESVHLAAGMLFSGCKGVIGTMWSIQDNDAPKVTKVVYERMLKDGVPNRKEAARALHEAVKELRESGADFLSWVPFIHMGR